MANGAHIRIMPDVHAGAGCVIGFTAKLTEYIVPNLIGVDIGCGVLAQRINFKLEGSDIRQEFFKAIDEAIHRDVPAGFKSHDSPIEPA